MPMQARGQVIDESVPGTYQVISRVVRESLLLGIDPRTGRDYSHRKRMLDERMQLLTSVFAIDCLDHSVLDNHVQSILRNRPDLVTSLSDREVAERWLRLNRRALELRPPPSEDSIEELLADTKKLVEIRGRLSSISWLMIYWKESLARAFNAEDHVAGFFWASRFRAYPLKNETSLLACSLFMGMNQVRAGLATSIQTSDHTSVHARLQDRLSGNPDRPHSGWLAPVHKGGDGYAGVAAGRRPSDQGYLRITFDDYLQLLDVQLERDRAERSGNYVHPLPAIVKRLGIERDEWEREVRKMYSRFRRELEFAVQMRAAVQPAMRL